MWGIFLLKSVSNPLDPLCSIVACCWFWVQFSLLNGKFAKSVNDEMISFSLSHVVVIFRSWNSGKPWALNFKTGNTPWKNTRKCRLSNDFVRRCLYYRKLLHLPKHIINNIQLLIRTFISNTEKVIHVPLRMLREICIHNIHLYHSIWFILHLPRFLPFQSNDTDWPCPMERIPVYSPSC